MKTKNYFAWTRNAQQKDAWMQSIVSASSIKEAREKFAEQGREIEKGTLKLSKF